MVLMSTASLLSAPLSWSYCQQLRLNDMDKISYLDIHARYLDIDMIQYDYGLGENQAFFRKIKRLF